jgi:hypothetical protein
MCAALFARLLGDLACRAARSSCWPFIPVVGALDDGLIVTLVLRCIGPTRVSRSRSRRSRLIDHRPDGADEMARRLIPQGT